MLKKMPIRLRLTVMTVALLTLCCVGLTFILNLSADTMATRIDATLLLPAKKTGEDGWFNESPQSPASSTTTPVPSDDSHQARMDFRMNSVIYMILVIVGGGLLTYYISGRALKPLNTLNGQMKNINVHNLSETLSVPPTKDEIAGLTDTFNEMTDKLDNAL